MDERVVQIIFLVMILQGTATLALWFSLYSLIRAVDRLKEWVFRE